LVAHSGDVERVEAQLGVLAAGADNGADNVLDPLGRIGADQADLGAAVLAETVEELLQCLLVTSGVRPQQHAGVVVDHHGPPRSGTCGRACS